MTKPITCRDTAWTSLILLCGKCARKSDGGFGDKGEDSLKTTLRRALAVRPRATRPHIIETRCMGLCPKNAVAALNPHHPRHAARHPPRHPARRGGGAVGAYALMLKTRRLGKGQGSALDPLRASP